ncbi:hypothetical protein SANBI_001484 [Sanguibacter sp. 4.1]|uniref:Uncharacterized protein n=1 Tax=Sanguibacter biliveldensis TaxID=3030830 RepID=A0AAF0Z6P4_9MICO|nr:hypothetical protein [Sanguibacter sp. 4.1]WPF83787.1 hypothetical protein SANBI_001484 [Sanguibacter sp. 4.1]
MTDAPQTMDTPRDARARAKAEKAYKKASRQKRFVLLLILIVIIAIWAASQSGSDSPSTPAQPSSAAEPSTGETAAEAPAAPEPGSAESDVVVTSCDVGDFDMVTSTLTVTNSTDELASYLITISANGPDGNRVVELTAAANSIGAGQSASVDALGSATGVSGELTCVVADVTRFNS